MNISYAAICMAYYIVHEKVFPSDLVFEEASKELEEAGHFTLMCGCNNIRDIDWKNPEPYVQFLPPKILEPYRFLARDWTEAPRYLRYKTSGKFVKKGDTIRGYTVTGGTAPHRQGSTGRVWHTHGEFFPSILGMEWR